MTYILFKLFILWILICSVLKKNIVFCKRISGLYIDNGIDQTIVHSVITKKEKREITRDILNFLDLPIKARRNASKVVQFKRSSYQYIHELYKNTLDEREGNQYSNQTDDEAAKESDVIMTYTTLSNHNTTKYLWFNVSETPKFDYLISAKLQVHLKPLDSNFTVSLFMIMYPKKNKTRMQFIESVTVTTDFEGWIKFNVTQVLQYWLNHPKLNKGLHLKIFYKDSQSNNTTRATFLNSTNLEKQPFLIGYFASSEKPKNWLTGSRWKRSSSLTSQSSASNPYVLKDSSRRRANSNICKLKTMYVRFKDLEFDNFIIAPEGYDAQFCGGECRFPLNSHMNATNHAIVQTLVHFLKPTHVPQACCAPRKLAHLPVLYSRDGENHVLKKYRNMIIKSCGCH